MEDMERRSFLSKGVWGLPVQEAMPAFIRNVYLDRRTNADQTCGMLFATPESLDSTKSYYTRFEKPNTKYTLTSQEMSLLTATELH